MDSSDKKPLSEQLVTYGSFGDLINPEGMLLQNDLEYAVGEAERAGRECTVQFLADNFDTRPDIYLHLLVNLLPTFSQTKAFAEICCDEIADFHGLVSQETIDHMHVRYSKGGLGFGELIDQQIDHAYNARYFAHNLVRCACNWGAYVERGTPHVGLEELAVTQRLVGALLYYIGNPEGSTFYEDQ